MPDFKMQLVDWLDDLCVRFIINLPQEELESVERICFQVEEAQWFYEDFIRPLDPSLPSMHLRTFCLQMFRHCPLLASFSEENHLLAFEEFLAYKTRVPVRGAILLNHAMDQVILVRGWKKGANWSFPRGKINKDERDLDCAVREVYEETGYDVRSAGLIPDESKVKFIEVTMREQHMKLYVFRNVPQDTLFEPRTRKEISKIQWYPLAQLPGYHKAKNNQPHDEVDAIKANKFYMVAPFLHQLKKWIYHQKKAENHHLQVASHSDANNTTDAHDYEGYFTEDNSGMQQQFEQARQKYKQEAGKQSHLSNQIFPDDLATDPLFPSSSDPASELKRLLSVTQTNEQQPAPPTGNAVDLLAMLRGNSTPQQAQSSLQPSSQSVALASPAEMSASRSSLELGRVAKDLTGHDTTSALPVSSSNGNSFFAPIQARRGSRQNSTYGPQTALQQSVESQNQRSTQQAPPPYQRTGDPQFARDTSNAGQQAHSIPPAADLPAPKLSSHAMNLLNVFKTGSGSTSFNPEPAAELGIDAPQAGQDTDKADSRPMLEQLVPRTKANHQHSESRSRQALGQVLSKPSGVEQSQPSAASLAKVDPPEMQPDNRKNALLELFRKPSNPSSPVELGSARSKTTLTDLLKSPTIVENPPTFEAFRVNSSENNNNKALETPEADPVELSAAPSPGMRSQKKQLFDHRDGTMKEHNPQPRTLNRPAGAAGRSSHERQISPNISATVSGPMTTPEFGAVRRKTKNTKTKEEVAAAAVAEPSPATQSPIQILKRPITPKDVTTSKQSSSPVKASRSKRPVTPIDQTAGSLPSETKKTPQQKSFQPRILRRLPESPGWPESLPKDSDASVGADQAGPIKPASSSIEQEPLNISQKPEKATRLSTMSPPMPNLERKSSNTNEQKQTLLSLFSTAKSPVSASSPKPSAAASLVSPVAAPSPALDANATSSSIAPKAKSPAPSLPPLQTLLGQTPGSASANGTDSRVVDGQTETSGVDASSRNDMQSSMSAGDRGFLLNYLQGFSRPQGR